MDKLPQLDQSSIMTASEPDARKIKSILLDADKNIRAEIVSVLVAGLKATKSLVQDGDLWEVDDYPTRLKYAEVITELIGERVTPESNTDGDLHLHFTRIQIGQKTEEELIKNLLDR